MWPRPTDADASGVLFAHGSRFGGHSLFIKDKKLYYVYNFLGIKPEQVFMSNALSPGKYTLGMEFTRESQGKNGEHLGTTKLYANDKVVASGKMKTQPAKFNLSGDRMYIGWDSGDAVSDLYKSPSRFDGETIQAVGVDTGKESYEDLALEAKRQLMKQRSVAWPGQNASYPSIERLPSHRLLQQLARGRCADASACRRASPARKGSSGT